MGKFLTFSQRSPTRVDAEVAHFLLEPRALALLFFFLRNLFRGVVVQTRNSLVVWDVRYRPDTKQRKCQSCKAVCISGIGKGSGPALQTLR